MVKEKSNGKNAIAVQEEDLAAVDSQSEATSVKADIEETEATLAERWHEKRQTQLFPKQSRQTQKRIEATGGRCPKHSSLDRVF